MGNVLAVLESKAGRGSAEHFNSHISAGNFETELSAFAATTVGGKHGNPGSLEKPADGDRIELSDLVELCCTEHIRTSGVASGKIFLSATFLFDAFEQFGEGGVGVFSRWSGTSGGIRMDNMSQTAHHILPIIKDESNAGTEQRLQNSSTSHHVQFPHTHAALVVFGRGLISIVRHAHTFFPKAAQFRS